MKKLCCYFPLHVLTFFAALCLLTSCHKEPETLQPKISLVLPQSRIEKLPSAFSPLSPLEEHSDWEKELFIGKKFAKEGDFYRAVTAFKRARFLSHKDRITQDRIQDIEYSIMLSYYLGRKYEEVIESFEGSSLEQLSPTARAYKPTAIALCDAYIAQKQNAKAQGIVQALKKEDPTTAHTLAVYKELMQGNISALQKLAQQDATPANTELSSFLKTFESHKKSVRKAEVLNAVLPGAGYMYVGQIQSGITSFLLNALFIAATWQFFQHKQPAAALITAGFEVGWYVGGIRGAGIAAKQYNDVFFSEGAKQLLNRTKGYPLFMIEYGF